MALCEPYPTTPRRVAIKRSAECLTGEKPQKPRPKLRTAEEEAVTHAVLKSTHSSPIASGEGLPTSQMAACTPTAMEVMLDEAVAEEAYPLLSREHECGVLDQFLAASLQPAKGGTGGCLYLSGGPGTGKTSVARGAAKAWRREHVTTRVLEINCMENLRPCSVPGFLLRLIKICSLAGGCSSPALTSKSPVSSIVASAICSLRSLGSSIILVVDEVDQLVQKFNAGDTSLEILCGLPKQHGAPPLAIVMIANHVDLLVKACGPRWRRVCSSLLFERYSWQQLKSIVQGRFSAAGKDGELAEQALGGRVGLELSIRRLAKEGDCRHIVRLCEEGLTKAIEMRPEEGDASAGADLGPETSQVSRPPVKPKPMTTQRSSDPLDSVKSLPLQQQLLLCAVCSSEEPMQSSEIFQKIVACMSELKQPPAVKPQVISALSCLEQCGMVSLQKVRGKGKGRGKGRKGAPGGLEEQLIVPAVSRPRLREALERSAGILLGLHCFAATEQKLQK